MPLKSLIGRYRASVGKGGPERCAPGAVRLRLPLRSGPIPADDVIGIRVVALWSAGRPARPSLPWTRARQDLQRSGRAGWVGDEKDLARDRGVSKRLSR